MRFGERQMIDLEQTIAALIKRKSELAEGSAECRLIDEQRSRRAKSAENHGASTVDTDMRGAGRGKGGKSGNSA